MYKKKEYRIVSITVPKEINYDIIFSKITGSEKEISNIKHSILLFLSFLNPTDYYLEKYKSEDYFKSINSVEFNKLTNNKLTKVKRLLLNPDYPVIDINESYQSGNYSKSYRLNEKFFYSPKKTVSIQSKISQNYFDFLETRENKLQKSLEEYRHLTKSYNPKIVTLNPLVTEYINEVEKLIFQKYKNHLSLKDSVLLEGILNRKIKSMRKSVEKIFNGVFGVSISDSNKRLNSIITNMKRELRSFLLIDGESTVEVDINSSHPYILGSIINKNFLYTNDEFSFCNLYKDFYSYINNNSLLKLYNNDFNIVKTYTNNITNPTGSFMFGEINNMDVQNYQKLPFTDGIYNYINKEVFKGLFDEKTIKKGVMNFLNMKKFRTKNFIVKTLIEEFPHVNYFIETIQKLGQTKYNLSILLQRVESYLLLEICGKVLNSNEISFITVHDSVIVNHELGNKTFKMIKNSIEKITGLPMGLKITRNNPFDFINETVEEIWNDSVLTTKKFKIKNDKN
ncbi:hypothetical protein [Chryseobacterium echinoideorum]|uniref:hypothetical protein n=1 Tax=Chryseobacterium echinoideorum TaxID=1549648 RepID=UPI0011864C0E|nr:hypothetical protein [Chryseobacterium echinoideorum]